MAELDLTAIAAASIATPAAGVGAVFIETTTKRLATKDDAAAVSNYVTAGGTDAITGVKTITNPTCLLNTASVPAMTIPAGGTVLAAAAAGAVETDGHVPYYTHNTTDGRAITDHSRWFRLTGNGSAISSIADFFGANDGIDLAATGVYEIEWRCLLVQNTGAGTHTWTITLSGAVTKAWADLTTNAIAGVAAIGTPQYGAVITFTATQAIPATGSMAAANHVATIRALIDVGASGRNVRLRLTVGTNNATPQAGSYFRVRRVSAANTGAFVA